METQDRFEGLQTFAVEQQQLTEQDRTLEETATSIAVGQLKVVAEGWVDKVVVDILVDREFDIQEKTDSRKICYRMLAFQVFFEFETKEDDKMFPVLPTDPGKDQTCDILKSVGFAFVELHILQLHT